MDNQHKIFRDESKEVQPIATVGEVTNNFLATLKWDDAAKRALVDSSSRILSLGLNNSSSTYGTTGLVVGYVQSGKTMSFTTVLALAADSDIRIAIVFAGTKNNLLAQTASRLESDLDVETRNMWNVKVIRDVNDLDFNGDTFQVIPVLKHYKAINDLAQSLKLAGTLPGKRILIVDDEADQASFNTKAYQNSKSDLDEFSATFGAIQDLRRVIKKFIYLQYTATPQAPILVDIAEILSPDWHVVLEPGNGYVGGKELFGDMTVAPHHRLIPQQETYHSQDNPLTIMPETLRDALREFLFASAIHLKHRNNFTPISMMVHPDRLIGGHKVFYDWVDQTLDHWKKAKNKGWSPKELDVWREKYSIFCDGVNEPPPFEIITGYVGDVLTIIQTHQLNSLSQRKRKVNLKVLKCAIFIGGEMLNRGYTVEGLTVTYMPRYTKSKPNADTLQQRARFFGYKQDRLDLIRLYLPSQTWNQYEDYTNDEEEMRSRLKGSQNTRELAQTLLQSDLMHPTRSNILNSKVIRLQLEGGRAFKKHAFEFLDSNNMLWQNVVDANKRRLVLFEDYGTNDRNHLWCSLQTDVIIKVLSEINFYEAAQISLKTATIQYLVHWKEMGENDLDLFIMGGEAGVVRERSGQIESEYFVIDELFSGRSGAKNSGRNYPGDKKICKSSRMALQLHHVRLKQQPEIEAWIPAIIYPSHWAQSYVSTLLNE